MSQGIQTFNSSGVTNMFSPVMNEYFFKQSAALTNTTSIPLGADFASLLSLSTPIDLTTATTPQFFNATWTLRSAGMSSVNGLTYHRNSISFSYVNPFYAFNANNYVAQPTQAIVHSLGKTTVASQDNYGFYCLNDDGSSVVVDSKYNSYYIQTDAGGNKIRTATAQSAPSFAGLQPSDYLIPRRDTIVFDEPLDSPPLIFIVQSSGSITLGYFNRDGNGKYVSASVFAKPNVSNAGSPVGWGFWGGTSYSFQYFIVSKEKPKYGADAIPWGVRVFNQSGQTIFDSNYFVPSFSGFNINLPRMALSLPFSAGQYTTIGSPYSALNTFSTGLPASTGVCLNNFNVMAGFSNYPVRNDAPFAVIGPASIFGRYLNVNNGVMTAEGGGTSSYLSYWAQGVSGDLNVGSVSTMPILTAKYAY